LIGKVKKGVVGRPMGISNGEKNIELKRGVRLGKGGENVKEGKSFISSIPGNQGVKKRDSCNYADSKVTARRGRGSKIDKKKRRGGKKRGRNSGETRWTPEMYRGREISEEEGGKSCTVHYGRSFQRIY